MNKNLKNDKERLKPNENFKKPSVSCLTFKKFGFPCRYYFLIVRSYLRRWKCKLQVHYYYNYQSKCSLFNSYYDTKMHQMHIQLEIRS